MALKAVHDDLPMRVGLLGVAGLVTFGMLLEDTRQNFLNKVPNRPLQFHTFH